jgi:hypothetical protein
MYTHFLDLAIAALLSLGTAAVLWCAGLGYAGEGEYVAEQLYSFTPTTFFGLGTDRPIGPGVEIRKLREFAVF